MLSAMRIRAAVADDVEFIGDMMVAAANWARPDRSREEVFADPSCSHYVDGWQRPSDVGVIAVDGDEPIGATWLRFFTDDDPGYGFVSADIPELSIGVVADSRGQGVGRALMRAIADTARQNGLANVSLSVERANPAANLYLTEGYRIVKSDKWADTMLLDLRTGNTGTG
jgi:GNAT superfamily N-acetyltransferase